MSPLLESVARAASGPEPEAVRVQRVLQQLQPLPPAERESALIVLAGALAGTDPSCRFLRCLAAAADLPARLLALELTAHWPAPLDRSLATLLRPLLLDRRLLPGAQLTAAVVLLQTVGKDGPPAVDLVRSLVTGLDATQVQERLDLVEQRLGSCAAVDELRQRLAAKLSTHCPQCGQALRRPDMLRHLWERHRLVLDAGQAREPWALLEDWVTAAAHQRNPDRLARCFELALHLDRAYGLARLDRLLFAYGLEEEAAACRRIAPAWRQHALRCPDCATVCPAADLLPVLRLETSAAGFAGGGYRVELCERGCAPVLTIEDPTRVVHQGREPGHHLTPRTAVWLLVGPPVLLAFLVTLVREQPLQPAILGLLLGLAGWLWLQFRGLLHEGRFDRAITHAWNLLVPRLHAAGFSLGDSAFVAGLARISARNGNPLQRERVLERCSATLERSLAVQPGLQEQLACLYRLAAEDSRALGRDPLAQVLRPLTRCLEGTLPLRLAEWLLADWKSKIWTAANLARLRVLLCERAFDADLEVVDLQEAAELAPALGAVLEVEHPAGLACLRRLWSLRTRQPWEDCGEAFTVFELAAQSGPGAAPLGSLPDLLLYQFLPGEEGNAAGALLVCCRGVQLGEVLLSVPMPARAIAARCQCSALAAGRAERWLKFLFDEFLPRMADEQRRPTTGATAKWTFPEATACPSCARRLLPQ